MSWGVAGGPSLWTWSVLDAKETYPGSGWVITPWAQTLQSLGTFTGASHQEVWCRLHNPDIESRVIYLYCVCGGLRDSGVNEKDCMVSVYNWIAWFFLIRLAYPCFLCFGLVLYVFVLWWSPFRWEQMWL